MTAVKTHREKIDAMMERTGMSYHQVCRRLGRRGALAAARNKRLRKVVKSL